MTENIRITQERKPRNNSPTTKPKVLNVLLPALAAACRIGPPGALANNLFVSSMGSSSIYRFETSIGAGSQNTFASSLANPFGLAFDGGGNLFAAGYGNGSIYKFNNTSGTLSSTPTTFASSLSSPTALTFDGNGNLFETDYGSGNIYQFTAGGSRSTFASGPTYSFGLAFESSGNLFVGDASIQRIVKFASGVPSTFASGLVSPEGLTFDSSGNLFVASYGGSIYEFLNTSGTLSSTPTTLASGLGHLNSQIGRA